MHFSENGRLDWLEFFNSGEDLISMDGLSLATRRDFSDRIPLSGQVSGGATRLLILILSLGSRCRFFYLMEIM